MTNRTNSTGCSTGLTLKRPCIYRVQDDWTAFYPWKVGVLILLLCTSLARSATKAPESDATREPSTAREFYNAGTHYLTESNLWRAEYSLQRALEFQDEHFQPPALYNLGHIRFTQGADELKKGPPAHQTTRVSKAILNEADEANQALDKAMESGAPNAQPSTEADESVKRLVAAYLQGRGARRDLRAATKAVKMALQAHQNTLLKWERSSGDFKSAVELNSKDKDARHNADVVDRSIAKLVDQMKQLQQMAEMLGMKQMELGEKMKKCRGQIPAPQMPPGAAGDDEEDDRFPSGKEPGKEEAGGKEERETGLTAEEAAYLLQAYKLDSDRRLPMTEATKAQQPQDRSKPTW